jgi:RND superfamily putative drug exporter
MYSAPHEWGCWQSMFERLGKLVSAHWLTVLVLWTVLAAVAHWIAPRWNEVTLDGDFAYLPERMTSIRGDKLMAAAFPESAHQKSTVVVIAARDKGKLDAADFAAVDRLVEKLTPPAGPANPIVDIWSYRTEVLGNKLVSHAGENGQATLILLQMRNEFMAVGNMATVKSIYKTVNALRHQPDFPHGLELGVSGSAALGADILFASAESIRNTELTTIVLVSVILLLVYRAPGLVIIPLATIGVSVFVSENLVALLAKASMHADWFEFKIFTTTEIFIIVILFGAGTDFCLFLVARYREELGHGLAPKAAISYALSQVGGALAGSAMTTILGLGMMYFADFGKYRNGGPAIAICLAVALAACVTLAPALLRAMGLWVFWPFGVAPRGKPAPRDAADLLGASLQGGMWDRLGRIIIARPGPILVVSFLLLAPLAIKGFSTNVNYDLFAELTSDRPSVQGTDLIRRHFPAGETGPIIILAYQESARFDTPEGRKQISELTKFLFNLPYTDSHGNQVQKAIVSVRSLTEPLGAPPGSFNPMSRAGREKIAVLRNPRTIATYLAQAKEGRFANRVTRFDLVGRYEPFSDESVRLLSYLDHQLDAWSKDKKSPWYQAVFDFVGSTAGIRDLKEVTSSDQTRIERLVVLAVLAVLIVLLRHPVICLYLILSVLFSYFITMGVTELFFTWLYGASFPGLDWKLPIFLFVILIAVGQDYNIYLVTRVVEEQARYGAMPGLRRALARTGGIITSCGVIMAGTFASMVTGSLRGMHELGFALSFGVLLDTLVIRTILVPAFLAIWQRNTEDCQACPRDASDATNLPVDELRLRSRPSPSSVV